MAKDKPQAGVSSKHLHARIAYLQQAATYLTLQAQHGPGKNKAAEHKATTQGMIQGTAPNNGDFAITTSGEGVGPSNPASVSTSTKQASSSGLPYYLTSHLTQVARKSQIRLDSNMKHSICKRCSNVLAEGTTSRKFVENPSKGGRKVHADVLVLECGYCGAQKRFPVGQGRQKKKGQRYPVKGHTEDEKACE
ncbi:hypothetical protein LTR37_017026 [Vermiconidia calcicola]|uniref:Uncharacterized protein n=1 Tax=Vermiconidia calcicola TaxID=1690605 RepID=A0ACC3MMA2_9PEZI|nr:hypothetical protein LTR37_017026 [Vermiconidia calcicola]